jgi:GT2 family glycosyltransferase
MMFSVVILAFNAERHLNKCLEHAITALKGYAEPSEVFVVENGSSDGTKAILKSWVEKAPDVIKPIYFNHNTGTTYSRNAALKSCLGKYVLVLDSDAYVHKDTLDVLSQYLDDNPECGMAVPRLTYASGNFQLSCDQFPTLKKKLERFLFLKKMEQKRHPLAEATEPTDVDYAISACWLIRRDVVDHAGYFDEKIFYSPEDVDYCIRVWEAGYKITYLPQAVMIHDAQELSRGFKLSLFHFSHLKGLLYLMLKHRYFLGLSGLYQRIGRTP